MDLVLSIAVALVLTSVVGFVASMCLVAVKRRRSRRKG